MHKTRGQSAHAKQYEKVTGHSPYGEKKKMDTAKLLQELTDTMCHWEGEDIAEKAEEILGHPVKYLTGIKYVGDSMFEVEEK